MGQNTDERLKRAIAALEELSAVARDEGLAQSEHFLEMAKLQLQLDLHQITDGEFNAFCHALEHQKFAPAGCESPAASHPRARRSGEMRITGRAWREPQDRTPQRGRARAGR
jgi:hypothetical protein